MTRVHVAKVSGEARAVPRVSSLNSNAAKPAFASRGWGASVDAWPTASATAARPDRTGLPNRLKNGEEALARRSPDGVRVHYDSARLAQSRVLAFRQGREIHPEPGQEQHLPHEAWQVVPQAQGRVRPMGQSRIGDRRVRANTSEAPENEATKYGAEAARWKGGSNATTSSGTAVPVRSPNAVSGVLQAKWTRARGGGGNDYYWEPVPSDQSDDERRGPPNGGRVIQHPDLQSLPDTAQRSGGSMRSLRTQPDYPDAAMDTLTFEMEQMVANQGTWSEAPTERGGLSPRPVLPSHPPRTSTYRSNFHTSTGHSSAAEHEQAHDTPYQGQRLEILHGHANSLAGPDSDDSVNLGTGSFGANSAMIPVDMAVQGHADIINQTHHNLEPGTQVGRTINHQFANINVPDIPLYQETIDSHRPTPTQTEWEQREEVGQQVLARNDQMNAASAMSLLGGDMQMEDDSGDN